MALREVTRGGTQVWIYTPPDECPHCQATGGWQQRWETCEPCRVRCTQWECLSCHKLTVDSDHARDRHGQDGVG